MQAAREDALGLALLRGGVAAVPVAARQRHRLDLLIITHLVAHEAADRLTVVGRGRRLEQEAVVAGQELADPAAPDDGISATEQEAVALAAGLVEVVAAGSE